MGSATLNVHSRKCHKQKCSSALFPKTELNNINLISSLHVYSESTKNRYGFQHPLISLDHGTLLSQHDSIELIFFRIHFGKSCLWIKIRIFLFPTF